MKLGDVLKKQRENKDLSIQNVAKGMGCSKEDYERLESGDSPAERWGPVLSQIAVQLQSPTSRLLAESGRSRDCRPGQAGELITRQRERRGKSVSEVAEAVIPGLHEYFGIEFTEDEYRDVEAGKSPLETYGPFLLKFSEVVELPVFSLFYPCGLPFHKLDDYP